MRTLSLLFSALTVLLLGILCSGPAPAQEPPQDDVPPAPKRVRTEEVYRLRVENSLYGAVELSTDGGRHYTLVGRVMRPASAVSVDRSAAEPGTLLRSNGEGVAFAVTFGQVLRLRPAPVPTSSTSLNQSTVNQATSAGAPGSKVATSPTADSAAIVTNIATKSGLFHFEEMALPAGVRVRMEVNSRALVPFPTLFIPSNEDVYVFIVTAQDLTAEMQRLVQSGQVQATENNMPPVPWGTEEGIRTHIKALGDAYLQDSLARAMQEKRTLIDGTLKLKAKLPTNEPDPIMFVTYTVDGRFIATQNVAPFDCDLNTRTLANGEHVIEIRALNRNTRLVTLKRSLITVWNR